MRFASRGVFWRARAPPRYLHNNVAAIRAGSGPRIRSESASPRRLRVYCLSKNIQTAPPLTYCHASLPRVKIREQTVDARPLLNPPREQAARVFLGKRQVEQGETNEKRRRRISISHCFSLFAGTTGIFFTVLDSRSLCERSSLARS